MATVGLHSGQISTHTVNHHWAFHSFCNKRYFPSKTKQCFTSACKLDGSWDAYQAVLCRLIFTCQIHIEVWSWTTLISEAEFEWVIFSGWWIIIQLNLLLTTLFTATCQNWTWMYWNSFSVSMLDPCLLICGGKAGFHSYTVYELVLEHVLKYAVKADKGISAVPHLCLSRYCFQLTYSSCQASFFSQTPALLHIFLALFLLNYPPTTWAT